MGGFSRQNCQRATPPPQKPDSEGGDLSAEGREGEDVRKSRASLALLQRQGRGNSCSGGFWVTRG